MKQRGNDWTIGPENQVNGCSYFAEPHFPWSIHMNGKNQIINQNILTGRKVGLDTKYSKKYSKKFSYVRQKHLPPDQLN